MAAKRGVLKRGALSPVAGTAGIQSVVIVLQVCEAGVVFWSRQAFALADELRVTLSVEGLPAACAERFATQEGWVCVRGFVVECRARRNSDGSVGYEISLVFEPGGNPTSPPPSAWLRVPGTQRVVSWS
jgi:hypothetical protein